MNIFNSEEKKFKVSYLGTQGKLVTPNGSHILDRSNLL